MLSPNWEEIKFKLFAVTHEVLMTAMIYKRTINIHSFHEEKEKIIYRPQMAKFQPFDILENV